jgi:histidine triad (HIT) family protein
MMNLELLYTLALKLSKTTLGNCLIRHFFGPLRFLLPLKRLRETNTLLAFHHPRPAYPFHVILVPKKPTTSLMAIGSDDEQFLMETFHTVQDLVDEHQLESEGFRLIVNGGKFQQFPLLHFHLIARSNTERNEP